MVGYDNLCVTSPTQIEMCFIYIYVLWNISDVLSKLQNTISDAIISDGTVRLVTFELSKYGIARKRL